MQTNHWSAAIVMVAIIVAGNVAADQHKDKAPAKQAEQRMHKATEPAEERVREEKTERIRDTTEDQGSQTSREMRARSEERKEIKEEYREGRTAGDIEKAQKKPWWKFWGSDEDS